MIVPVTFEELQKLDFAPNFNEIHGTDFTWGDYFEAIGITSAEAMDNRELEYEHYLRWVALRNSPLYKALS